MRTEVPMYPNSKDFDPVRERERFIEAVLEGLADVEAGRLLEHEDVKRELDREFGSLQDE